MTCMIMMWVAPVFVNSQRSKMSYQVLKEDDVELQGYPATASGTPRGYVYVPMSNQSQQTNTTTVVASQPQTLPQVAVSEPKPKPRPAILIFSIVLTVICSIHLCLPALVCLTPGLIFAIVGYSLSDSTEQRSTAKAFHGVSLCCNIASIIYYVLAAIAFIVTLGVYLGFRFQNHDYDYSHRGCYEDCSYSYGYYSTCPTICVD